MLVLAPLLSVHAVPENLNAPTPKNAGSAAQQATLADSLKQLVAQVNALQSAVTETRAETARLRAETIELRRELAETRARGHGGDTEGYSASDRTPAETADPRGEIPAAAQNSDAATTSTNDGNRIAKLEEEYQLLTGKVNDQHQSKVESASKYKVRLSGIALFNLFAENGHPDSIDVPSIALPPLSPITSKGSFGATLRQSQIGFEVFGPELLGAKSSANIQFDFAGGFPSALDGTNYGLVRLRTGMVRLDWRNSSIVAGQDSLFFSPENPTSLASLAVPALSYAGNLWEIGRASW